MRQLTIDEFITLLQTDTTNDPQSVQALVDFEDSLESVITQINSYYRSDYHESKDIATAIGAMLVVLSNLVDSNFFKDSVCKD